MPSRSYYPTKLSRRYKAQVTRRLVRTRKRSPKKNKRSILITKRYSRSRRPLAARNSELAIRGRSQKQQIKCWKGFRRVSGKKPGSRGSCVKA